MTLTVEKYYDHAKATADLRDYQSDISLDLMRQPGLFAYYNVLFTQADGQHDRLSNAADVIEARLDSIIREEMTKAGDKITEGAVKSKIKQHPRMREAVDAVREAREQVGYLKGMCEALRQRRDTLLQLSFNMREELKGSPTVMSKSMKENHGERVTRFTLLDTSVELGQDIED